MAAMIGRMGRWLTSRPGRAGIVFIVTAVMLWLWLPARPVRSVPFDKAVWVVSRDGARVACWIGGVSVGVFDTHSQRMVAEFAHSNATTAHPRRFSADGRYLLVGATLAKGGMDYPKTYVWDLESNGQKLVAENATPFCFSPDGTAVATSLDEPGGYRVVVWEIESSRQVIELAERLPGVACVDWSADGKYLVTSHVDGSLKLWSARTGRPVHELPNENKVNKYCPTVSFSGDGRYVFGGQGETLWTWEVATGRVVSKTVIPDSSIVYAGECVDGPLFNRRRRVRWAQEVLEGYQKWMPAWLREWVSKQGFQMDCVLIDPPTASWRVVLSPGAGKWLLRVLPDAQQALVGHFFEPKRLEWWDIPSSTPWGGVFGWSALVAGGYWVMASLRARRRSRGAGMSVQ